ncbi:MAG: AEC family transporter, partial [Clostridia bacterium]|nr:AEC family transporter [Clostridia bacterium]
MGIVLEQVFILFIFLGIGYLFGKTGIVKHSHAKIISVLLTNLILPCRVFNAISNGFTVEYIKNYYVMLLISLGLVVLFLVLGSLASDLFTKNAYERKVYIYTLVTPNFGYMG